MSSLALSGESDDDLTDSHATNSQLSDEGSISFLDSESVSSCTLDITMGDKTSLSEVDGGLPLFPGSRIPSAHFNIVFMSLVQRHNLTYACETDGFAKPQ